MLDCEGEGKGRGVYSRLPLCVCDKKVVFNNGVIYGKEGGGSYSKGEKEERRVEQGVLMQKVMVQYLILINFVFVSFT